MTRRLLAVKCAVVLAAATALAQQPSVHVKPSDVQGSRPVEKTTETGVVRDYLQSWKTMNDALGTNNPALLEAQFVGTAHDKLAETIAQQAKLGIQTRYQDRSHDLQIIFYSPEGLSIQLVDTVQYDEQVLEKGKVLTTRPITQRYLVVLTPSEVRWRVRIFQPQS